MICTVCALLLATQPAAYAKSGLTEEQRLAYVCAGCRLDLAEAERVRAVRVQQAAVARQAAAASREARPGVRAEAGMCEHGRWRENCVTCVLAPGEGPVPAAVQEGARRRQRDQEVAGIVFRHRPGGRPTVPAVEQKLKARDRQRAYRARRRSAVRSA